MSFFGRFFRKSKVELVPFYDFNSRITVRIPKHELASGSMLVQIDGMNEPVYVDSTTLEQGGYQHGPFEGYLHEAIEQIRTRLSDVCAWSYSEWEDGFRRDRNAEKEIAGWTHLSAIMDVMTSTFNFDLSKRQDCFQLLVACFTAERSTARAIASPKILSDAQCELAIKYFYEGGYA